MCALIALDAGSLKSRSPSETHRGHAFLVSSWLLKGHWPSSVACALQAHYSRVLKEQKGVDSLLHPVNAQRRISSLSLSLLLVGVAPTW